MKQERVRITEIAPKAEGVSRLQSGKVIFIPRTTTGDEVRVEIKSENKGFARGLLLQVHQPGPHRRTPICQLAESGACGGCPLMHVTEEEQLRSKERWVKHALRHVVKEVRPILSPTSALHYRIRARFICHNGVLGFQGARSNESVQIFECPILSPTLEKAMCTVAENLKSLIGEGGELQGVVGIKNDVHLTITLGRGAKIAAVHDSLEKGVMNGHYVGVRIGNWQRGETEVNIGSLERPLFASADSFAQASTVGQTWLPHQVAQALLMPQKSETSKWNHVLELFAGAGNLTRALVDHCEKLTLIEESRMAVEILKSMPYAPPSLHVIQGAAEIEIKKIPAGTIDAVVLDPPRQGCFSVMSDIVRLHPARIVYLSCDPMTLARDLQPLCSSGYQVKFAQPIDLFPQTAHVETLVVLERELRS